MHIADPETGNLGANAIVGGSAGIATGAALSAQMRGSGQVAGCFFGDGELGLSDKTVKNYLSHVFEKLSLSRRAEAAAFFARRHRPRD